MKLFPQRVIIFFLVVFIFGVAYLTQHVNFPIQLVVYAAEDPKMYCLGPGCPQIVKTQDALISVTPVISQSQAPSQVPVTTVDPCAFNPVSTQVYTSQSRRGHRHRHHRHNRKSMLERFWEFIVWIFEKFGIKFPGLEDPNNPVNPTPVPSSNPVPPVDPCVTPVVTSPVEPEITKPVVSETPEPEVISPVVPEITVPVIPVETLAPTVPMTSQVPVTTVDPCAFNPVSTQVYTSQSRRGHRHRHHRHHRKSMFERFWEFIVWIFEKFGIKFPGFPKPNPTPTPAPTLNPVPTDSNPIPTSNLIPTVSDLDPTSVPNPTVSNPVPTVDPCVTPVLEPSGITSNPWMPTADKPIQLAWQLTTAFNKTTDFVAGATVYDIDGESATKADVDAIHAKGFKAVCYVDVGAYEKYRGDASSFPESVIGGSLPGWPGVSWLDIRQIDTLKPIMEKRIKDWCYSKGFDAIEPDDTEVWSNNSGFSITKADNIAYAKMISDLGHKYGMSVGLKGNNADAASYASFTDWALSEQCYTYGECGNLYDAFVANGQNKAVFIVQYDDKLDCSDANSKHMNAQKRDANVVGPTESAYVFESCKPAGATEW